MMGYLHVSVAVLSLLCVGHTAPLNDCDSLVQPLEIQGPEQLLGNWMVVAASSDSKKFELVVKNYRDSYWIKLTADNESGVITHTGVEKWFGHCVTTRLKLTLTNSTLMMVTGQTLNAAHFLELPTTTLLKTSCSDCLLFNLQGTFFEGTIGLLMLMSKRQTVTAAEMEELQKQAACLNLMQPLSLNFDKGICPEPQPPESDLIEHHKYFQQMLKISSHRKYAEMMMEVMQTD